MTEEKRAIGKATILIPAFNEEEAIPPVIEAVRRAMDSSRIPYEVLVVDDGSTDSTREKALAAGARVISLETNRGTGAARTRGILKAEGECIAMLDADGSYPADRLPELIRGLEACDMTVGARTTEAGTLKFLRAPVKALIKGLAEYMMRRRIPDLNTGMRAFRKKTALRFLYLLPDTHSWVSTITLAYLANGLDVRYMPISYHKRIGRSSFHPLRDTYNMVSLSARTVMYFFPLRVFLPLAFLLAGAGVAKSLYSYFVSVGRLQQSDIVILLTAVMVTAVGLLADLIVVHGRRIHMEED
ncbi:MAG: glycosyltransferase family 2 protein [Candidatus Omnitrophica bacterium]|nr:glycosyltransferase family 2 protein [Candidatus Omnitrophota bacterium]